MLSVPEFVVDVRPLLLILLFLLSNQSNWIIFLISQFHSSHSQIFFSSTIFNFMMFVTALFFASHRKVVRPTNDNFPSSTNSTFFSDVNVSVPTANSQQLCSPTCTREECARHKTNFIYDFCQQIYVFCPFSFAGSKSKMGERAEQRSARGMRNEKSFRAQQTFLREAKNKRSPQQHTTHPNLGTVSVAVVLSSYSSSSNLSLRLLLFLFLCFSFYLIFW